MLGEGTIQGQNIIGQKSIEKNRSRCTSSEQKLANRNGFMDNHDWGEIPLPDGSLIADQCNYTR